jgi:hypothetical protein
VLYLDDLFERVKTDSNLTRFKLLRRGEKLPPGVRVDCRSDDEPERKHECFALGFYGTREWLYSAIRETQPLTYAALLQSSDLYLLLSQTVMRPDRWGGPCWYVEAATGLVRLNLQSSVPLCSSIEGGVSSHGHYLAALPSLGHDLAAAYCSLVGGMDIPSEIPGGLEAFGLPRGMIDWQQAYLCILSGRYGVHSEIDDSRAKVIVARELEFLRETFDFLRDECAEGEGLTPGLRCFLDTRSTNALSGDADFVIVQTPKDKARIKRGETGEPLIYRVKNHEWEKMQVTSTPARAIDAYVAQAIGASESAFDFDAYCRNRAGCDGSQTT